MFSKCTSWRSCWKRGNGQESQVIDESIPKTFWPNPEMRYLCAMYLPFPQGVMPQNRIETNRERIDPRSNKSETLLNLNQIRHLLPNSNMSLEMVDKAMELKELIDAAHIYLPQISRCISLAQDYMQEKFGLDYDTDSDSASEYSSSDKDSREEEQEEQEDEEDEEEKVPKARTIQVKLRYLFDLKNHARATFHMYHKVLTVHEMEFDMDAITEDTVKAWYDSAINSTCGNVVAQQPQHDRKVRLLKELDASKFTVNQETLDHVAELWADNFGQKAVAAQPYKLVIYPPGDHVTWHIMTLQKRNSVELS
jgi:hypothetical protein